MIQSMTGFGKSEIQLAEKKITISIKSLNSKNLDLNLRIPPLYRQKEMVLRSILAKALQRGKIDFSMQVENVGNQLQAKINTAVVENHIETLSKLAPNTEKTVLLQMAIQFPDVLVSEEEKLDAEEWKAIENAANQAILDLKTFRKDEGDV